MGVILEDYRNYYFGLTLRTAPWWGYSDADIVLTDSEQRTGSGIGISVFGWNNCLNGCRTADWVRSRNPLEYSSWLYWVKRDVKDAINFIFFYF